MRSMIPSTLPSLATAAFALLVPTAAMAGPPVTPGAPQEVAAQGGDGDCGHSATVARWVPSLDPAARFIVANPERFVALGRTAEGFWSSQWTTPNDACDDCGSLDLVFTRFSDGKSTRYPVLSHDDRASFSHRPDAGSIAWAAQREVELRDLMLRRLWRYAATVWPVATLRHDYAVVTPPRTLAPGAPPDALPAYRGWLVGVVQGGHSRLRFTVDAGRSMCWCTWSWRAFVPPVTGRVK
jgi:hypothetical protein